MLNALGAGPGSDKAMQVLSGRYGPYVTDGLHASLPKSADPATITIAEAEELLKAREAMGPSQKKSAQGLQALRRPRPPAAPASEPDPPCPSNPSSRSSGGAGRQRSGVAGRLARRPRRAHEMRPAKPTAVHKTAGCAELVCSNSFRGDKLDNAVGLLKEEMRRLGSLIMQAAETARVPAGAALAVDRDRFSAEVTTALAVHPLISIVRGEVPAIPPPRADERPRSSPTGPLTSDALSADLVRMVGAEHLYFYDAISPIVLAESIDRSKVFRASRWDRSLRGLDAASATPDQRLSTLTLGCGAFAVGPACGVDDGQGDYLNCPFTRDGNATASTTRWWRPNRRPCTISTTRSSSRAACPSR